LFRVLPASPERPEDVPKTLIYVRTRAAAYEAATLLQARYDLLGPSFGGLVRPFTALSSDTFKTDTLQKDFRPGGRVRILVATEAGGLGIDIPDIKQVIQYELPSSLLDLAQHFGRTMRSKEESGLAILFAQRWSVIGTSEAQTGARQSVEQRQRLETGLKHITNTGLCMRTTLED
ncbi:hypothetical protein OC834_007214, partial [Tilletia horrida]